MNIKFKNVTLSNFCGVQDRSINLYDRTMIKGVNAVGKTTVMNAIFWVLFNRLVNGSSADDKVRPHDADGNNIDLIDVLASLSIDFDGKEVVASKTQKQNWVTDRTTSEQKFKGNVNEYEINGIPKKEKDFVEYISQFIDLDTFGFCMNPRMFFNLDTKKRREMLFSLVGDVTDADVIATNEEFEPLKSELMDGTVDELLGRCRKAIKALEDNLKTIPARVDELSHQLVEVDAKELNDNKAVLTNLLEKEQSRITDLDSANAEYEALVRECTEARRKLLNMSIDAETSFKNALADKNYEIQQIKLANARINATIIDDEKTLKTNANLIESMEREIEQCRESWEKESALEFDADNLVCPVCGSTYSADKIDEMRKDFEAHKAKKLDELANIGKSTKERKEKLEESNKALEKAIAEKREQIAQGEAKMEELQKEADSLTQTDVKSTKPYKALEKDVKGMEERLGSMSSTDDEKKQIMASISEINQQINAIDVQLSQIDNNEKIKARMKELKEEQIATSQKIANQEMLADLLTKYQRTKVEMLTEKINSYFSVIKWQMFKEQINGGYADVCIPLVDGTSYDGLLNHGNKILAEIDLCRAFQKANDVTCPILIDDSESLDEWRIPQIESQLIILRRTDDKELTVEEI